MAEKVILTQEILDECKREGWGIRLGKKRQPEYAYSPSRSYDANGHLFWLDTSIVYEHDLIGKEGVIIK